MEIRQLRYFLAVAEQLNFTRAANLLHVTQPTLSQQIAELEDQLGVRLFERGKKGAMLTNAGQMLLVEAQEVLARYGQMEQRMAHFRSGSTGTLTMGTLNFFETTVVPDLVSCLHERFPGIRLLVQQYPLDLLRMNLLNRKLDVEVTILPRGFTPSFAKKLVVNHDQLVLVIPRHSVYAELREFDQERLAPLFARPLFLWDEWYQDEQGCMLKRMRELCPSLDVRQATGLTACLLDILVEDGYSILPLHIVLDSNQTHLTCIPIPFPEAELDVAILWAADNANPCLPYFVEVARKFVISE